MGAIHQKRILKLHPHLHFDTFTIIRKRCRSLVLAGKDPAKSPLVNIKTSQYNYKWHGYFWYDEHWNQKIASSGMHKISLQARDDLSKPLFLERNICNNCTCIKCTWSMYCRAIAKSLYKPTSCFFCILNQPYLHFCPMNHCFHVLRIDLTRQARNALQTYVFLKEIVKPYLCCLLFPAR